MRERLWSRGPGLKRTLSCQMPGKKGQDIVERARREARVEAEKIVEAAVEEAEREKENRLAHAAAEIESEIQLDRNASQ